MGKVIKAYPWIGAVIGAVISIPILILAIITVTEEVFTLTCSFTLTPIIGCFYGRLMEDSKRALIIGGIVGFLFGLHPVLSSVFTLFGVFCFYFKFEEFLDNEYIAYIFYAIVSSIIGIPYIGHEGDLGKVGWIVIIQGWIPILNCFVPPMAAIF